MKYSFLDIIKSLPKKKNSNSSLWVKVLIRKISFLFTYLFINLGFSPNAVSVFSIFVSIAAFVCFSIPNAVCVIIAVSLINFWLVLDCVDGNIARCRKLKTTYGEFVDDIGGYYVVAFVYLAISICAFHQGGLIIKDNYWIIVCGGASCVCDILARLINKDYVNFSKNRPDYQPTDYINENKRSLSYIRRRIGKELGVSGLFMPMSIVCAIFNTFDIMTLFYLAFNAFALVSTTVIYIYKASKYDATHGKEKE